MFCCFQSVLIFATPFFTLQSNVIENTIEEMLARLDEFSHLADTVSIKQRSGVKRQCSKCACSRRSLLRKYFILRPF